MKSFISCLVSFLISLLPAIAASSNSHDSLKRATDALNRASWISDKFERRSISQEAINSLEKALLEDSLSIELHTSLARAYELKARTFYGPPTDTLNVRTHYRKAAYSLISIVDRVDDPEKKRLMYDEIVSLLRCGGDFIQARRYYPQASPILPAQRRRP